MGAMKYHLRMMPAEARQVLAGHKAYRWCPVTFCFHVWFGGKTIEVIDTEGRTVDSYGKGEWYALRAVPRQDVTRAMESRIRSTRRLAGRE